MNVPTLSIVIPTHNRAQLLPRALRSVLRQSDPRFELVVVDDGSDDGTARILGEAARDSRVRWLRNELALGPAAARNRAIQACSGDWIAFLDDDDELLPDFVAALRRFIAGNPSAGLIWSGVERQRHGACGNGVETFVRAGRWDGRRPLQHSFLLDFTLSMGVAVRRGALLAAGRFDLRFDTAEDIDLAMRLVAAGTPYASMDAVLYRAHIGEGPSISRSEMYRPHLRLLLLRKNETFLATQPGLLRHYRSYAMSACYREGMRRLARQQAAALLQTGWPGFRALEILLRFEILQPLRGLLRRLRRH